MLLSWSGGKDSALALARLRRDPALQVVGLITTVTSEYERISIHGVRRDLLHRQADAVQLPLCEIRIEPKSSNASYETAWAEALSTLPPVMEASRVIAFGDIYLEDVREYREAMVRSLGFTSIFPLWGEPTGSLAEEVIAEGYSVRIVCVDTEVLPADLAGCVYDSRFIDRLPGSVDPCGERGEFHTFVSGGPGFRAHVDHQVGETVIREARFAYCDLTPDILAV